MQQFYFGNILNREKTNQIFQLMEDRNLIQVIAGAGYGKTQAVLSYVSKLDANVVWISFTVLDNYSSHFWDNFCHSIGIMDPELSKEIKKLEFPEDNNSMRQFIKLIIAKVNCGKPNIMVFDDCHMLNSASVINFLKNIISISIEGLKIFLLSRTPMFSDITLGNHNDALGIVTYEQLAFTLDEINVYFTQQELPLPYNEINKIYKRTEGWPIAVSLFLLSSKEKSQPYSLFFKSENHLIYDIMEEEIFCKYSSDEQNVLIKLSLIDQFPLRLFESLTSDMRKENFKSLFSTFLIRYNTHTESYQFHQLFREFLHEKLFLLSEREINEIYMFAGEWYEKYHLYLEAMDCYRKLNGYEDIWRIIKKIFRQIIKVPADIGAVIKENIKSFPESFIEENPLIRIIYALTWDWAGDFIQAISEYKNIIENFAQKEDNDLNRQVLGEAQFLQGLHCMLLGDTSFKKYFEEACKNLPDGSWVYNNKQMVLSNASALTLRDGSAGELKRWLQALEESSDPLEFLSHKSTCGFENIGKAEGAYYSGDLDGAMKHAHQAIYRGKKEGLADIVCNSYFILSKIAIAQGEYSHNVEFLNASKKYAREYSRESVFCTHEIAEGFYYAQIQQINKVPDWITNSHIYNRDCYVTFMIDSIIKSNCMLLQENYTELIPYLSETENMFKMKNQFISLIYTYILKAIVYQKTDNTEQMMSAFQTAYDMSYRNGIIMPFIEYGRYMRTLIRYIENMEGHGFPKEWLSTIHSKSVTYAKRLNHLRNQYDNEYSVTRKSILSKAEIGILEGLSQGLTREEIAETENISLNTVKTQIKSIYSKLGAINGMHAINIAMAQGILSN